MNRKNIFDSFSEMKVFQHLQSIWCEHVMIAHHIPVTNVFPFDALQRHLTNKEFDYIQKTSFDFVVISKEKEDYGIPLLVIEFDGLAGGYSSEDGYNPKHPDVVPYRKLKMDCKMKICKLMKMPFVIVSYPEIEKTERHVTILDGIIGQVLADRAFMQEFQKQIAENHEEFLSMPPIDRQSYFDWIECDVTVATDMKYNPILRGVYEMSTHLSLNKIGFNLVWHSGYHEGKDGYQIYEGWAQLDKKFSHLLTDQMETLDGTEEINESDSLLERYAKLFMRGNTRPTILIRKKIKIRSLYCEHVNIPKLAEDLAHFLILSDITERWNLFNLPAKQ